MIVAAVSSNGTRPHAHPDARPDAGKTSSPLEAIRAEAEHLLAPGMVRKLSHAEVLGEIISGLSQIDFHAECGVDAGDRISQKQLRVVSVREILGKAREMNCGLAKSTDFIYAYNGNYWSLLDKNDLEDFLGRAAEKLGVDWITAEDYKFRSELHKQFLSAGYLPSPDQDNEHVLINLRNGTFEVSSAGRKLREFRRQDFLTYQLPFSYDPDAIAPIWQKFLDEVLPDRSWKRKGMLRPRIGFDSKISIRVTERSARRTDICRLATSSLFRGS